MTGTVAVAARILRSVRGDPRTLGLVVVVPAFIVWLVGAVFADPTPVAPILLAVFVFVLTYILTAIGFLRERMDGTLDRVLVSPISRVGLVAGYVLGYGMLATVQSVVLLAASVLFLELSFAHGVALVLGVELLGALTGLGLGVVLSLFARSEFEALQFIPVVITPQVLIGGTFRPVAELPVYLAYPALLMPVTHLIDAMEYVVLGTGTTGDAAIAAGALVAFAAAAVGLATLVVLWRR